MAKSRHDAVALRQIAPTAISLFAGAGGCSLGFGQAGYDVRFATDLDADAVESYRRKFGSPLFGVAEHL